MRVTAVVESLASKPAPFRDRRDAPLATRKFNGIRLDGVDG